MTALRSNGRPPNPDRVCVYIDGFNLYFGLRSIGWSKYYWLDVVALSRRLLKRNQVLAEVRYFTARINRPPEKVRRQAVYLDALAAATGCDMQFGRYRSDERLCKACGAGWPVDSEKKTDVNIAVAMLLDAADDRFDTAILISGDSDLVNAVHGVQQRFAPKRVWMAFPPHRFQTELEEAALGRVRIREWMLAESQLPPVVVTKSGARLHRPAEWE